MGIYLPVHFQQMWGDISSETDLNIHYFLLYSYYGFALCLYTLVLSSVSSREEHLKGTFPFLMTLPISQQEVLLGKTIFIIIQIGLLGIMSVLTFELISTFLLPYFDFHRPGFDFLSPQFYINTIFIFSLCFGIALCNMVLGFLFPFSAIFQYSTIFILLVYLPSFYTTQKKIFLLTPSQSAILFPIENIFFPVLILYLALFFTQWRGYRCTM
jgi:hypothetical protein